MDRCKCPDTSFGTRRGDELESGGNDEVREEWVVDFIHGCECFSEGIKHGIQLRKALEIAPLEVDEWCRVLRRHVIDIQESPLEECPEFRAAG